MTDPTWTVIVPVKGTANAKSRLGADRDLADAIAVDTVVAAVSAGVRVIVVTPSSSRVFAGIDVTVVDDPGSGLAGAVTAGIESAGSGPTAVLLGDLPALLPADLGAALAAAEAYPRALVADADGTGSTLITAASAALHVPHFGPGSRELHLAAGYVELAVPASSGLRRDVDTPDDLAALAPRLGRATRAVLAGRAARAAGSAGTGRAGRAGRTG
ncbi:2-phospho-L-lactate guanylyltransferase [Frondihabitans sucicola]|uniref:2-phospho-L-lactate guanylyltransferase n=1 Tax=Frondihabitans sucicola TaxID=1268041 RepID=A0ABM8GK29_9MICO|nr:2-phospho-L-lactate guanylyltransferase [Frondihabitans sucicola]BDZ48753.1 2-phospho-L-lactate guanylyltransferase [Frondihabitans sucicola]